MTMVANLSGNPGLLIQPDATERRPSPTSDTARDALRPDRPSSSSSAAPQILDNDSIARRVEALNESEGVRQRVNPEQLPLRSQQALSTFAEVEASGDDSAGELVGLDMRV